MYTALILQNFPALSADLSNTGIHNFICFRGQKLKALNVSRTKVLELNTLENEALLDLDISYTAISNLSRLLSLSLRSLNVSHSAVQNVAILRDLKSLEKLTIHKGQLSDEMLGQLSPDLNIEIVP